MSLKSSLLLATLLAVPTIQGGDVRGVVVDARGGESLARVRVQLFGSDRQTVTGKGGQFEFKRVTPGAYALHVETVGYRLLKQDFSIEADEDKDFQIVLSPDTFRRTDSVTVRTDPFEHEGAANPSALALSGQEVKNLGTVLVDDPIRAVQSLPGVQGNNDFYAQFSVYAAPFASIGLYLDNVLLHAPFHTVASVNDGGSLSVLNGDSIESITLLPVAFSSEYGDRWGSVVEARTREGSRTKPSVRLAASVAQANVMAEGPLGRSRKGSWLASLRKSYSQYVAGRLTDDPSQAFGYLDQQGKLTYDLTPHNTLTAHVMNGQSDYDQSARQSRLGVNSLMLGDYRTTVAQAGWRYYPSDRLFIQGFAGYLRESYANTNRDARPLNSGYYGEWTGGANGTWYWSGRNALQAGYSFRRLRADGSDYQYQNTSNALRVLDRYRGTAARYGGYVQQTWNALNSRVRLSAGVRLDSHDAVGPTAASPHFAAGLRVWESARLELGWGQYVQYPELQAIGSTAGGKYLLPTRSNHYVASLDQRLGPQTRVRVELYQRENRDVLARPLLEPRIANGRITSGVANPLFYNSVRGYSRGLQIMLQSRTANRLSGWLSYTLGYARDRDGIEQTKYWSLFDQRHTVNIYLSYRIRPSVNLSGKFLYGSANPLPGFFRLADDGLYYLSAQRNTVRLGSYQRTDFRANKSLVFDRWKLTLYAELINATNHKNNRFTSYNGVDTRTGRVFLTIQRVFPILPSAGLMLEF